MALAAWLCAGALAWMAAAEVPVASDLRLPAEMPVSGFGLVPAFGQVRFEHPVALVTPPGETNRLFVVERTGRIMVLTNLAEGDGASLFLDLQSKTFSGYEEAGLLGLAFHPGYQTNGFFFVFRSLTRTTPGYPNMLHQQLSRFRVSPADPNQGMPDSELPLIAQVDQSAEHNGGDLKFGPDGYLYASFGDTGPPPKDRSELPQPIDNGFFGCIVRIDVDQRPDSLPPNPHPASSANYAIPPDNPFVGVTEFNGVAVDPARVRTEFYALGLRNPWRMAFDPVTGQLLCGDVGGSDWEEINLIERGRNYGWPYFEGEAGQAPAHVTTDPPLLAYRHGYGSRQGLAVIGGPVYRGRNIPALEGSYLFGDYGAGNIWAVNVQDGEAINWRYLFAERGICAFGVDPGNGDILLANHMSGAIRRLVYAPPETVTNLPLTLAETGIFTDLKTLGLQPGFHPYSINVPFWSDHAVKRRWFALPNEESKIGFDATGSWQFPAGTVWVKHFDLPLTNGLAESSRRLETRVLVKTSNSVYGLTYRWGRSLFNASLVPDEGAQEILKVQDGDVTRTQTWHYPSRAQCLFCHTPQAGYALGFNTAQLNRAGEDGREQLDVLSSLGCFEGEPPLEPARLPRLAAPADVDQPLSYRARSYLAANCAQCHQPDAPAGVSWDARITTPLAKAGLVEAPIIFHLQDTWGLPVQRLAPHSVEHSMVVQWMNRRGVFQMPPVSTSVIDTNGVELLSEWINSFPRGPWREFSPKVNGIEGYSEMQEERFTISAVGEVTPELDDSCYGLFAPLSGYGQLVVRLNEFRAANNTAGAGIICRTGAEPGGMFLALLHGGDGRVYLQRRNSADAEVQTESLGSAASSRWLRIAREDQGLVAYVSSNRVDWTMAASLPMPGTAECSVGLVVLPTAPTRFSTAVFENVSLLSFTLEQPLADQTYISPGEIPLQVSVLSSNATAATVEFFAGTQTLGKVASPPYIMPWRNPFAGTNHIRALVTDTGGVAVLSAPVEIRVVLGRAVVQGGTIDASTRGNWQGRYGQQGYALPGSEPDLPVGIELDAASLSLRSSIAAPDQESPLQLPDQTGRNTNEWAAPDRLSFEVQFSDAQLHELALYFLDTTGLGLKQQVELYDVLSNRALRSDLVEDFGTGKYLAWKARGHLRVQVVSLTEQPALLSGIFFGPAANDPPSVRLLSPGSQQVQLPVQLVLEAEAHDRDGAVQYVEFLDGNTVLGTLTKAPYRLPWPNVQVGQYALRARAVDELGEYTISDAVPLEVLPATPIVEYLGADPVSHGDWQPLYSRFIMAGIATNLPPEVTVEFAPGGDFTWARFLSIPSALQNPTGIYRTAATWHGSPLRLRMNFRDGAFHQVALYFLDWDSGGRIQDIWLADPDTQTILDHRVVTGFGSGVYLLWKVRGSVQITIEPQLASAILSGLFFDPKPQTGLALHWLGRGDPATDAIFLRGPAGAVVQLSASADLLEWTPLKPVTIPESSILLLSDIIREERTPRFYRAELLSP